MARQLVSSRVMLFAFGLFIDRWHTGRAYLLERVEFVGQPATCCCGGQRGQISWTREWKKTTSSNWNWLTKTKTKQTVGQSPSSLGARSPIVRSFARLLALGAITAPEAHHSKAPPLNCKPTNLLPPLLPLADCHLLLLSNGGNLQQSQEAILAKNSSHHHHKRSLLVISSPLLIPSQARINMARVRRAGGLRLATRRQGALKWRWQDPVHRLQLNSARCSPREP